MIRKKIYVGHISDCVVHYDQVTKGAYISKKSSIHSSKDQEKSSNNFIIYILVFLLIIGSLLKFIPIKKAFSGVWTIETLWYLVMMWVIVAVGLVYVTHKALHSARGESKYASKETFEGALEQHPYWQKFGAAGKIDWKNYISIYVVRTIILLCNPMMIFVLYKVNQAGNLIGAPMDSSIIMLSLFGVIPGVTWIMWFENNPAIWLHLVSKYQKGKLPIHFAEEFEGEINDN